MNEKISGRSLKKKTLNLLQHKDFNKCIKKICALPLRQVINPLISFLYSNDQHIRWRAISAIGVVVNGIAEKEIEASRNIIRRLIWNLNDESGGIGWGSPEALAEILAQNSNLANEYSKILLSYINPCLNLIENKDLQKGVLWGIGRLALVRPELIELQMPHLAPFINGEDAELRGLAVWILSALSITPAADIIDKLILDKGKLSIYYEGHFTDYIIGNLVKKLLNPR